MIKSCRNKGASKIKAWEKIWRAVVETTTHGNRLIELNSLHGSYFT